MQKFQIYLPSPAFQGKELCPSTSLNEKHSFLLGDGRSGPSALAVVVWTIHLGPQSRNCYQLLRTQDALWLGQSGVALRGKTGEPWQLDIEKHWVRVLGNASSGPILVCEKRILIPKNWLGRLLASSSWKYAQLNSMASPVIPARTLRKEARCWASAMCLHLTP